jgi:hypothetical protein
MPEKETIERAKRAKRRGKAPSSQAGEFVREEIHHIREGKHGARSTKQAIAIGLSKARRAGVDLPPPAPGKAKAATRRSAARDYAKGKSGARSGSARRARATRSALKREGRSAASSASLSRQARTAASRRTATERRGAARKAARTKGSAGRRAAAQKAATTRKRKRAAPGEDQGPSGRLTPDLSKRDEQLRVTARRSG